jgi:hypothetical protein
MLKEFDEFVDFCFEHGGTLRNHKQFGEMARKLRPQIEAAEHSVHPTVLCTCFKNNLGTINVPSENCPVHKSHSG